jgi:hypothetical protein
VFLGRRWIMRRAFYTVIVVLCFVALAVAGCKDEHRRHFIIQAANQPPSLVITQGPSGNRWEDVTIKYALTDLDGDVCGILVEYSTDGGKTWKEARSEGAGSDGMAGLTSSATGTAHTFVWDTVAEGLTTETDTRVRIRPHDTTWGTGAETNVFSVRNWITEIVPGETGCSWPSVVIDGAGKLHTSYYRGPVLSYSVLDGSQWIPKFFIHAGSRPGGEGGTSVALDTQGRAHISYYRWEGEEVFLTYGRYDGKSWERLFEEPTIQGVRGNSIVLDATGLAHISYSIAQPGGPPPFGVFVMLKYAQIDPSQQPPPPPDQVTTIVDGIYGLAGWYSSIALDTTGRPYISYIQGYPDMQGLPTLMAADVRYADYYESGWRPKTVDRISRATDSGHCLTMWTSITVDGTGGPHISYCSYFNDILNGVPVSRGYLGYHGPSRGTENVDTAGEQNAEYGGTAIGIDGSGHVSIAYIAYDASNKGYLKFARLEGSEWAKTIIDDNIGTAPGLPEFFGGKISMVLDGNDLPHIIYTDFSGQLKYAHR